MKLHNYKELAGWVREFLATFSKVSYPPKGLSHFIMATRTNLGLYCNFIWHRFLLMIMKICNYSTGYTYNVY